MGFIVSNGRLLVVSLSISKKNCYVLPVSGTVWKRLQGREAVRMVHHFWYLTFLIAA